MSVREKPVSNRFLELLDRERSYRRHVKKVANTKATINTTQPETPRRFMVAERNNTRYRNGMRRTFVEHDRMVATVERPRTANVGSRPTRSPNMFTQQQQQQQQHDVYEDVDIFSRDIRTPDAGMRRGATVERFREPSSPETPKGRARKVDAVRIGFGPKPIIEAQEIEDESPVEQQSDPPCEEAVAVPCDDGFDGEAGMFVT